MIDEKSLQQIKAFLLSRMEVKEKLAIDDFQKTMEGIWSSTINLEIIDEATMTYKNMEDIVSNITPTAEIVKIIKPIYNYKSDEA